MCSNQLSKLPGLGQLTALERLAMAKNQIRSVWPGLERLRNLRLGHCHLKQFDSFRVEKEK
jgi:Leucine-rich repeat (LRR) protein